MVVAVEVVVVEMDVVVMVVVVMVVVVELTVVVVAGGHNDSSITSWMNPFSSKSVN